MFRLIFGLLITCAAVEFGGTVLGEEDVFREVLKKSVEHRTKVTSFVCDFHAKKISNITSNSETFQLKIEVMSKGTIHYDELTGVLYSENTNSLEFIDGSPPDVVEQTRKNFKEGLSFRLLDGQSDYVSDANSNDVRSRVLFKDIGKQDLPFPIFDLGLSLPGDQDREKPLNEVANDLISLYGNASISSDADGLIWCDFSSNQFIFDSEKDYWPIRRILWGRRVRPDGTKQYFEQYRCDMKLEKSADFWMPSVIEIKTPTESQVLELEWKSINKTINPQDHDPEKIAERLKRNLMKPNR